MFDLSQPIHWQVVAGTIGLIFLITAVGIAAVKMKKKRREG
ncbi:hypothetical protein [Hydrogenimonas cancrithermarum]|nr:hypothetical protein [Hydrogenimonas cancrithermarum]